MDGNWYNYLKYIRIDRFINAYSDFVKIYNRADDTEKLKIERDFIIFLFITNSIIMRFWWAIND